LVQDPPPPMSDAPAFVSSPPIPVGHSVLSKEEKVEYRDQDGNLLDPEQVKALEGKVSFKTRYETRTRVVDAQGNEIPMPENAGVAPPHPDVDNVDRETVALPEGLAKDKPASQRDVTADESKEESIERSEKSAAKPASEGNEATA
jgi:dolichyl-phosphate-mannose-protein mannosyltransferase